MLRTLYKYLRNYIYKSKFRLQNKNIYLLEKSVIDKKCTFEGHNLVGRNTMLLNCHLGVGTYISENVVLKGVKIGKFCSLGSRIFNTAGNHPSSIYVSTHPAFFSTRQQAGFTFSDKNFFEELKFVENFLVKIGNDVWIGDDVTIQDGVTIGDGAIIGAKSLVTRDIEPYTVNVGIPCKPVRYRFNKEEIEFLLNYKWWERDFDWLQKHSHLFQNIDDLMNLK